jgi:hypothetical protein
MEGEPKEFQKQITPVQSGDCKLVKIFPTRNGAIVLFILGLAPVCLFCVMGPGYLISLLNPPKARLVFIGMLVWHGFGCYLFARTRGRIPMDALYRVIIVLFLLSPSSCGRIWVRPVGQVFLPTKKHGQGQSTMVGVQSINENNRYLSFPLSPSFSLANSRKHQIHTAKNINNVNAKRTHIVKEDPRVAGSP